MSNNEECIVYTLNMDETLRQVYMDNYPSFEQFLAVLDAELGMDRLFNPWESAHEIVRVSTTDPDAPKDQILGDIQEFPMSLWSAYEKLIMNHNATIELEDDSWYDFTIDKHYYEMGGVTNKPTMNALSKPDVVEDTQDD